LLVFAKFQVLLHKGNSWVTLQPVGNTARTVSETSNKQLSSSSHAWPAVMCW